jgi:hypothetical protein
VIAFGFDAVAFQPDDRELQWIGGRRSTGKTPEADIRRHQRVRVLPEADRRVSGSRGFLQEATTC